MNKRKSALRDWGIVLLSLLDDVVVLAVILFVLNYFRVQFTLPVIIVLLVLFAGYVLLMHRVIVPSLHLKKTTGSEGMVGLIGTVVKPLRPTGEVKVYGEYWRAQAAEGEIAAGEEVEVVGIRDLTLTVRRRGERVEQDGN